MVGRPVCHPTVLGEGESAAVFLADGSLMFTSKRPEPGPGKSEEGDDAKPALWLLPAAGGEARRIAAPPGGVLSVAAARHARRYLIATPAFPGASGFEQDAAKRKARTEAGVSAILHEGDFTRYWDHDRGPDCVRLLTGEPAGEPAEAGQRASAAEPADLTPEPGRALDEQAFCLAPDGSVAVTGWSVPEECPGQASQPGSCTFQTRTTGYSSQATARSGTRPSSRSSPSTCSAKTGAARNRSEQPPLMAERGLCHAGCRDSCPA
jgi:hypothetical protein